MTVQELIHFLENLRETHGGFTWVEWPDGSTITEEDVTAVKKDGETIVVFQQ